MNDWVYRVRVKYDPNKDYSLVIPWLNEHIGIVEEDWVSRYNSQYDIFYFNFKEDALMFRLRWA